MSALERFGLLALCMVILPSAMFHAPGRVAGGWAPAATAATPSTSSTTVATPAVEVTAPRGRRTVSEPELIVSVGRFRIAWPEDACALSTELRRLTEELCFSMSAVRLLDYASCSLHSIVALQDNCRQVTASTALAESRT